MVTSASPRKRSSKPRMSRRPSSSVTSRSTSTSATSPQRGSLHALTTQTTRKIDWERILRVDAKKWKWVENCHAFSIYTKQGNNTSSSFGVLAIGVVKASVHELASLLASHSQSEYVHKMTALYQDEFKRGTYIGDVSHKYIPNQNDATTTVSVRTATFGNAGWLQKDEEWCYLEETRYTTDKKKFEKTLTTLQPHDVDGSASRKQERTTCLPDVLCGYRVEIEQPDAGTNSTDEATAPRAWIHSARVRFYGELPSAVTRRGSHSKSSDKTTKQRLLQLAKSCDRLAVLVRRRRLGMQVLVDQRMVFPSLHPLCFSCRKSQLIGQCCRLCGQDVCRDCSAKYERESRIRRDAHARSHVRVDRIRVCDQCLARVESADYSGLGDTSLPPVTVSSDNSEPKPDLKALLRDALLEAPTSSRKESVMSVIRCVLDQEKTDKLTSPSNHAVLDYQPIVLTPQSTDRDYVDALTYLDIKSSRGDQVQLSTTNGRSYVLTPERNLDVPMPYPIPPNEELRLELIEKVGVLATRTGPWEELNIICEIAAKELDAFAGIVTIVSQDQEFVIAANVPALENLQMNRDDGFCGHAIMSTKPLIVSHPEADIRFSRITPVTVMGLRFYCGFPLILEDGNDTVIGILCCIDHKPRELTESQFVTLQKLSQTAAKIVRIQSQRRRSSTPLLLAAT